MSDELALTLSSPEVEKRLAVAMRTIGRRITERSEIIRALAAADQLAEGYVITEESQGVQVADLVAQIIDGERLLTAETGQALRIPKAMEKAVRESVGGTKDRLERAKQVGNSAQVTWRNTLRRRAAEEDEKRRLAAQEAARKAAEAAAETGEDEPPPAEMAPVEVPRTVVGGIGKVGIQVRIEPVEIVDFAAVPRPWLALVPAKARENFAAAVQAGMKKPEPGTSVIFCGVRFEARESVVNRR